MNSSTRPGQLSYRSGSSGSQAISCLACAAASRHSRRDFDAAAIRQKQAADSAQGGGLCPGVGSSSAVELAARNGEIYAVNGWPGENLNKLANTQARASLSPWPDSHGYCFSKTSLAPSSGIRGGSNRSDADQH